jgi:hypothetical protein
VRSTVLGGEVLTEMEPGNNYTRTFVYAGGSVVATQESWGIPFVWWEHRDPSSASYRTTPVSGQPGDQAELDPVGANAGISNGAYQSIPEEGSLAPYPSFGNGSNLGTTYSWDGIRMPADEFFQTVNTLLHGRFGIAQALMRGTRVIGTRTITATGTTDDRRIWVRFTEPIYGTDPMAMGLLFTEPQKTAQGSGIPTRTTPTSECNNIRTILFGNWIVNKTLVDTYDRARDRKQEQGGLLGEVIDDGPYSGNWVAQPFYRQGGPSWTLKGMTDWQLKRIAEDKESIHYRFSYHAHPFQKGEKTPEGLTAGDPNEPSGELGDRWSAGKTGLRGIVISKNQFVVYDKDRVLCRFQR